MMTNLENLIITELDEQEKNTCINKILADVYTVIAKEITDVAGFITSPDEKMEYLRTKLMIVLHRFVSRIALRSKSNLIRLFSESGVIKKLGTELCDIENDITLKLFQCTASVVKEPQERREAYIMTVVNNFLFSLLRKKTASCLPLDTPIGEGSGCALCDIIPDSADTPEEAFVKKTDLAAAKEELIQRLSLLNKKSSAYVVSYLSSLLGIAPREVVKHINTYGFDKVFCNYISKTENEFGICLDGIAINEKSDFNREKTLATVCEKTADNISKITSVTDKALVADKLRSDICLCLAQGKKAKNRTLFHAAEIFVKSAFGNKAVTDDDFNALCKALVKAYLDGSTGRTQVSFSRFAQTYTKEVDKGVKLVSDAMADKIAHQRSFTSKA